ncbi:hypothetical protein PAXRUDRAFT_162329 [Paxillus rubicundulus Ve08.2h10]|uniref:RNase H type-1 domain-containing protein n=1 Tax=Paxillus rubicundulus Ve08.2h10 TaxID=930991 RepID=A0A0D0DE34_9AGAM|nr:hypothetical protein PAXRUDRAFT_162329 [Paxillus rubicundulus Ve08.2h10]
MHPIPLFFYLEALIVAAAIRESVVHLNWGGWIAVYSDNLNTVQIHNSLAALPSMNWMLMDMVNIILAHDVDFRVFHVSGSKNTIADHLSCLHNHDTSNTVPGLSIQSFQPPQRTLGATEK